MLLPKINCLSFCLLLSALVNVRAATEIKPDDCIRLRHVETGAHLHSHRVNYTTAGSSTQQQVTGFLNIDNNDLWYVRCQPPIGPLTNGSIISLEHLVTRKLLHSHPVPAPVTTDQHEVSCYGGGDQNDFWTLHLEAGGVWKVGDHLKLIHRETKGALHSHPRMMTGYLDQQEVTTYTGGDKNDWWVAVRGGFQPTVDPVPKPPPNRTRPPLAPLTRKKVFDFFCVNEKCQRSMGKCGGNFPGQTCMMVNDPSGNWPCPHCQKKYYSVKHTHPLY
jgi:hypothetical protein